MNCEVCGNKPAEYRCPACKIRTCSISCVKRHKQESGCTGIRPRVQYIPPGELDDLTLVHDCELQDEAHHACLRASEIEPKNTKISKRKKLLQKAALERGITIMFMPPYATRATENKTTFDIGEDTILWTIAVIWKGIRELRHRISHEQPIEQFLQAFVKEHGVDDGYTPFLKAEGAEGGGYMEIDMTLKVGDILFATTVIEFPTLEFVENSRIPSLHLVTVFQLKKPGQHLDRVRNPEQLVLPSGKEVLSAVEEDIKKSIGF